MTVFAICMTALSGLLLGFLLASRLPEKKPKSPKSHSFKGAEISNEEYFNFLNYDGTEQK